MSYSAIISRVVNIRDIQGADKIKLATIRPGGFTVIIGADIQEESLGIFFNTDGQLSEQYCVTHNLLRRKDPITGENIGGYLESSRRIKCLKLRGEKSEGYWAELDTLKFTGYDISKLKEGDLLTELNSIPICNKYFTPATARAMKNVQKQMRKQYPYFPKHMDTKQFKHEGDRIPIGSILYFSAKAHGCVDASTKITMFDGSRKRIIHVNVGEYILGMNKNGAVVPSKVIATHNNGKTDNWLRVRGSRVGSGLGNKFFSLYVTPNHKFHVQDKGYVEARNLKEGVSQVLLYRNTKNLSEVQFQILLGIMLGDGYFTSNNSSGKISFSHKKAHLEYFNWISQGLGSICNPTIDERFSGFGTEMIRGSTIYNFHIKQQFESFLESGKKHIPEWVINKISPIALAFWYMDDGTLSNHPSQEDRVGFATCAFNKEDCEILAKALGKFGLENVKVFEDKSGYFRIRLNADDAEKFFLLVTPYIPKIMQYKLPERYRGYNAWLPKPESENSYKNITSLQYITEIKKVDKTTYKHDLTTETGNFFANGVLVHNSSLRYSHVLDDKQVKRTWWQKLFRIYPEPKFEFDYLLGTRNVVLDRWEGQDFYDNDRFRHKAVEKLKGILPKGTLIFGETVGYQTNGKPIMPDADVTKLKDKEVQKLYGKIMKYSYNCTPNGIRQCRFLVYRIARITDDGHLLDLSWPQVKAQCRVLGLETVKELAPPIIYDGNLDALTNKIDALLDKPSVEDNSHIEEGAVIRVEAANGETYFLKSKGFIFRCLEGLVKDNDNYVDLEEIS